MPIADVLSGDLLLLIGAGLRIVDCGQLAACAPWLADACGGRARAAADGDDCCRLWAARLAARWARADPRLAPSSRAVAALGGARRAVRARRARR